MRRESRLNSRYRVGGINWNWWNYAVLFGTTTALGVVNRIKGAVFVWKNGVWSRSGLATYMGRDCRAHMRARGLGQFLRVNETGPIEPERFHLPFSGAASGPKEQKQSRDEQRVNLEGGSARGFSQPMPARKHGFKPLEEQFDLPAVAIDQSDHFRRHVLPRGGQEKGFPFGFELHQAQSWSTAEEAEFLQAIGEHARLSIRLAQDPIWPGLGANHILANAHDEVHAPFLQLFEMQQILSVEPIHHVKIFALGLLLPLLCLRSIARRNAPISRHLIINREVQMESQCRAKSRRGRPSHTIHRAQHRPIHNRQCFDCLADPWIAEPNHPVRLPSQAADHLDQNLWIKKMLRFG